MTKRIMKEVTRSRKDKVNANNIIKEGDWVIKWSEHSKSESGFELFTPSNFDPEADSAPLGGLVLSAIYFIVEHGHPDFGKDIVSMANELARHIRQEYDREQEQEQHTRTLN